MIFVVWWLVVGGDHLPMDYSGALVCLHLLRTALLHTHHCCQLVFLYFCICAFVCVQMYRDLIVTYQPLFILFNPIISTPCCCPLRPPPVYTETIKSISFYALYNMYIVGIEFRNSPGISNLWGIFFSDAPPPPLFPFSSSPLGSQINVKVALPNLQRGIFTDFASQLSLQ